MRKLFGRVGRTRLILFLAIVAALVTTVSAGAASLAGASPAGKPKAKPVASYYKYYKVVYEGSGKYSRTVPEGGTANGSFKWHVAYGVLGVYGPGKATAAEMNLPASSGDGTWSSTRSSPAGGNGGYCQSSSGTDALTAKSIGTGPSPYSGLIQARRQSSGAILFELGIVGSGSAAFTGKITSQSSETYTDEGGTHACTPASGPSGYAVFVAAGRTETSTDPLSLKITLPKNLVGYGKNIRKVGTEVIQGSSGFEADCSALISDGCTQSFEWSGTVTFTRVGPSGK